MALTMETYHIGELEFDPDACEICSEGQCKHLQPQVRNVLSSLYRHRGEVVTREMLMEEAWSNRPASDESITRCISILRKHIADHDERTLIETIPKVGYRLHCTTGTGSSFDSERQRQTAASAPRIQLGVLNMGLLIITGAIITLVTLLMITN